MRHLLTFELSEEGDKLTIHGDPPGLRLLAERISELATKAETESTGTRLVYQVRIVAKPPRGK